MNMQKAYEVAIKSGDVEDSFEGFSSMMKDSLFNETGEPIEICWPINDEEEERVE